MEPKDISPELFREYERPDHTWYKIEAPIWLWVGETTHRVQDSKGMVHCIPRSYIFRWQPRDTNKPVQF